MRTRMSSLVAMALGVFLAGSTMAVQAAEQHKWRMQTALVSGSMYFELLQDFSNNLEKMSGGRIKIEVLPEGAVTRSFEILDAVNKGLVEAGFCWTHFWSGKHPAAYLFSDQPTIAGLDQLGYLAWYYEGDGYKYYKKLYKDILKVNVEPWIIQVSGGQPLGWFKKPISSLADFRKLKYRSPPGLTGELFKEMGVSAVALPAGELVPAAQRGVIDAAEWINPGEDIKLGLHQVWKNYYLQGFHQASDLGEILINKDAWNKLSPDLQEIVKVATQASVMQAIAANIYRNAVALRVLQKEHGVKIYDTPKDLYPEFLKASDRVLAKYSAQDPFFKEVVDSQRAFARTVMPYWTKLLGLYTSLGEAATK